MDKKMVLCVDDELNILHSLKRLLRKEEYQLLTTESAHEGLELLKNNEIQLVVSDYKMPEMTGTEFLKQAKEINPDAIRVILSGFAEIHVVVEAINQGEVYRFLVKPWSDDELKMNILQCLEQYDILQSNIKLAEQLKAKNEELEGLNEKLKQTVDTRTNTLRYTQDIIECLPIPILGVSTDGMLVLTNEAYRNLCQKPEQSALGSHISNIVPGVVKQQTDELVISEKSIEPIICDWYGKKVRVYTNSLKEEGKLRGCIIAIEDNS